MKKFFYVMMSAVALCLFTACGDPNNPEPPEDEKPEYLDETKQSNMEITLGVVPITKDTTIDISEYEENPLTGAQVMEIRGFVRNVNGFRVTVTRSEAGLKDELCAGVQCLPGDGEKKQDFDYKLPSGQTEADWYAHFTPAKEGTYTIAYQFQNYNRSITLTVNYNFK